MSAVTRLQRIAQAVSRQRSVFDRPRVRAVAVLAAVAVFAGGLTVALSNYPDLPGRVTPGAWLLVLACVPLTVLANASQFWLTARLVGSAVGLPRAMLVTILSTAANMLPLPGGSLVRIAALKSTTNTYRQTTFVTVLIAGCWLGVTMGLAGSALCYLGFERAGMPTLAAGIVALLLFGYTLARAFRAAPIWLAGLFTVQALAVGVGALRLWLCFMALGESVDYVQAAVLTLSTVIAAIIGVAPAGLGVTELLAAGIAEGIDIDASFGFLAAALDRVSGLLIVGPAALLLYWLDVSARDKCHADEPADISRS